MASDFEAPLARGEVDVFRYDALVIPGGHAAMEDLHIDPDLGRLLIQAVEQGLVIVSVCHGPAALLSATPPNGDWLFGGPHLVSLIDEEEDARGTAAGAPWLLESRLREQGARFEGASPWSTQVVHDGPLITVRNPNLSLPMAETVVSVLADPPRRRAVRTNGNP